jgi:hypothetical protein
MSKGPAVFQETVAREPAANFAQEHFSGAALGHKKRNAALVRVAEDICRHPGGTLPNKFKSPSRYKAMDLLMNRPEVTHDSVLAPHQQRTRERIAQEQDVVLYLHDITVLDYSGLSIPELGPIGNGGGRGYLCHNSLAVSPRRREVLGLANQILHRRVPVGKKEGVKAKRQRQSRESRLWCEGVQAIDTPEGIEAYDVGDRGADIFEFLALEKERDRNYVIRATHNRAIRVGHEGQGAKAKLFDHLRTLPAAGTKKRKVFDRVQGQEREVQLSIAFVPVRLQPPHVKKGEYKKEPLSVWALRIWEAEPPAGQEPLEWFVLTNKALATVAQAWEISSYYECRYMVEEYHKGQKTGCDIERLQFETEQALQPMIALLSVVAVMLLNLRLACRQPDAATRKASEIVDSEYEQILRAWRYKEEREEMSVKEFYMALGRLGGHMNRKSDGPPGWLVLWRGWMELQAMLKGAEAERRRQKKCRVT